MIMFVPPDALKRAREIDLYTYLRFYEPTELVRCGPNVYCTRTHDSLKISNGMWYWWSQGFGGKTALDYLIRVKGMRLQDAVELLTGDRARKIPPIRAAPMIKTKKLMDVPRNSLCEKVRPYLLGRCLDPEIVDQMISEKRIAEDNENGFALFFGFDEKGVARQCSTRSTDGSAVKKDVSGSDRRYCFQLDSEVDSDRLWVFESAIDLLSFATIMKQSGGNYKDENLLSLSGVYMPPGDIKKAKVPTAIKHYLGLHPQIKTVHLCLDNDKAGLLAAEGIKTALGDSVAVKQHLPPRGKDWNDYLKMKTYPNRTKTERKNYYER